MLTAMLLCFLGWCTVVLEAPDHVLLVRSQGKMIDPQTGGESNMTTVTDPQNIQFVFGYQLLVQCYIKSTYQLERGTENVMIWRYANK